MPGRDMQRVSAQQTNSIRVNFLAGPAWLQESIVT